MNTTTDFQQNYIKIPPALSWDEYFMLQAMMASFKSKDPVTKVGCVIVDQNHHQITMGYNGFVSGIDETKLPWGKDKTVALEHQKYGYVVHSEANAILHSPRSIAASKVYVTCFPCHECAKLIASSKVEEVIYLQDKHAGSESNKISKKIFDLSGIPYRALKMEATTISNMHQHFSTLLV